MADGEASPGVQAHCLALWAADAQARERWRDYQLIGDVLRSQELARHASHDAAFVQALRERLKREPVVLRPRTAAPQATRRARTWGVPMAAMAGVAAVAGVVVVLRGAPDSGAPMLAKGNNAEPMVATSSPPQQQPMPTAQVVNGRLIRDARLDRYFTAHRQSANGTALQMPGSVVRSVDTIVLEDR
ncbi:MAG: sigma-E factor negative regulatory protein [Burkholderiaceae bacterium]|nr:sigma-E factor negative regulatory protein [Burkholderiaceae bacterium]